MSGLTRARVGTLVDSLRIRRIADDANGIQIQRAGQPRPRDYSINGRYLCERWRLASGSGIAGHSGEWWLRHLGPGRPARGEKIRGPFATVRDLTAAIRAWRRWE